MVIVGMETDGLEFTHKKPMKGIAIFCRESSWIRNCQATKPPGETSNTFNLIIRKSNLEMFVTP